MSASATQGGHIIARYRTLKFIFAVNRQDGCVHLQLCKSYWWWLCIK